MENKAKMTAAQARTLADIIKITDTGARKWSCVSTYKPALALLALGYVKKDEKWSTEYKLILEPTVEGRAAVG